ncbi:PIG-L family deacetylase [Catenuloplanes sp. NPDC051500]|uniref:PIG-L family deacetylase n=1 Tax=Catenuloplanes sp. NPDC051500 TaxID=3363959 RepID=UPI00379BCE76
MSFTVVAFHAHPDDESLLTGGTLARAAAEGHRVVLVTATLGEAGLASPVHGPPPTPGSPAAGLGGRRHLELLAAADALGCARVEVLGYRDSGLTAGAGGCFADAPVPEVADRLAALLREERADVLIGYDARGGYGHPDHVQVHRVAAAAARLAGTPVLLEATVDRRALRPLLAVLRLAGRLMPRLPLGGAETAFTPHTELTHAVDVRTYLRQKRAGLRAHASQSTGGRGLRTVAALAGLPGPLFAAVAGREWFAEVGRARGGPLSDDIFASLRS